MLRRSRNCMRLATACGAVCENSSIVAVEDAIQQLPCCAFVYIGLVRVLVENAVERKDLVFRLFRGWDDRSPKLVHGVVFWRIEYSALD